MPVINENRVLLSRSDASKHLKQQGTAARPQSKEGSNVIGEKFPTPSRASAAARLASQKVESYKPGVSAGISGTGYDVASVSSAVSSEPGGEDNTVRKQETR